MFLANSDRSVQNWDNCAESSSHWTTAGASVMSPDKCRLELRMQLGSAAARGEINVLINSGELLRAMGWSPGLQHWTASCCEAMEDEQADGDILLLERALGAGMTILYRLPRTTT
jgi:hypothetical protein